MSFKGIMSTICDVAVPSIIGGLCAALAFDKGYKLGHNDGYENGFKLGEACGRLVQKVDDIDERHKSDKKEEASN